MRGLLRRLFERWSGRSSEDLENLKTQYSWMFPPSTVVDAAAWDHYWQGQLSHGVGGMVHLFVDDGELVDAMRANALRRVLCVGNGISQEPRALAWAGFEVTALDISPLAAQAARDAVPPDDFLAGLVGGRSAGANGQLEFVVGDLIDPTCCPGPYDLVIERKTLQLWPEVDRPVAMQAVVNRLAPRGIFFSHCHDGRWRPPAPRLHPLQPLIEAQGWEPWRPEMPLTGRAALLALTTG